MHNLTTYAIDIETVSQGKRATDYVNNMPDSKFKVGNVKDPAKIQAKIQEAKDKENTRHGLHWSTGKVVSVVINQCWGDKLYRLYGHDEKALLERVAKALEGGCNLYGKSSENFDFPFLVGRFMANDLPVPTVLKNKAHLFDVDKFFGWSSASSQRGSLDRYAHALTLDNKPMNGGMVQGLYDRIMQAEMDKDDKLTNELWKELLDYNQHDTEIVKQMVEAYHKGE